MWAIQAQVMTVHYDRHGCQWKGSKQVPTFYLDERTQGIPDDRAALKLALDILSAGSPNVEFSVTVARVAS